MRRVLRHLPTALACLIAALIVQWVEKRIDPLRRAGSFSSADFDGALAGEDFAGAYKVWCRLRQESPDPAREFASQRVGQLEAELAGVAQQWTPGTELDADSRMTVTRVLRRTAVFAPTEVAEALLQRALKVKPFAGAAEEYLWEFWHRSGDLEVDAALEQGVSQMVAGNDEKLNEALRTFKALMTAQPHFAEGINKLATVLYMLRHYDASLETCKLVLQAKPGHFGALSGAGLVNIEKAKAELRQARGSDEAGPSGSRGSVVEAHQIRLKHTEIAKRHLQSAHECFLELLKWHPHSYSGIRNLRMVEEYLGIGQGGS